MNKDVFKGKWKQLQGTIRQKWADLTDDEIGKIQGDAERFVGVLQEKYGWAKDRAEREFNDFLAAHDRDDAKPGHRDTDDTEGEGRRRRVS